MSACQYDAGVLGNHDFAFGAKRLVELIDKYDFPLLTANCQWPKEMTSKNITPYKIFELDGVKVAVIGTAAEKTNHRYDDLVKITKVDEAIAQLVPELRKKADIIILITHVSSNRV